MTNYSCLLLRPHAHPFQKFKWNPWNLVTTLQKSCFIGPTIFKFPQPNWRYNTYLSNTFIHFGPPSFQHKHRLTCENKKYIPILDTPAPWKWLRNIWKIFQEPSFKEVPNLTDKMQAAFWLMSINKTFLSDYSHLCDEI